MISVSNCLYIYKQLYRYLWGTVSLSINNCLYIKFAMRYWKAINWIFRWGQWDQADMEFCIILPRAKYWQSHSFCKMLGLTTQNRINRLHQWKGNFQFVEIMQRFVENHQKINFHSHILKYSTNSMSGTKWVTRHFGTNKLLYLFLIIINLTMQPVLNFFRY